MSASTRGSVVVSAVRFFDAHERAEVMFTLFNGANAASLPDWAIGSTCAALPRRVTQTLGLNQRVTRRLAAGLESSAARVSLPPAGTKAATLSEVKQLWPFNQSEAPQNCGI